MRTVLAAAAWDIHGGQAHKQVEQVNESERQRWEQQKAEDRSQQRRSGPGWHGRLDGYAPVQGFGVVDGHAWYFRARGTGWSFEVAEPAEVDWTAVDIGQEVAGWRTQDEAWSEEKFAASYMPYATAWAIIQQCIARFRQEGLLTYPAHCSPWR
jgi:hypothetical protein